MRAAKPSLADWPEDYVDRQRECYDDGRPMTDARLLTILRRDHIAMRGGRYLDLNVQMGHHLEVGDGLVTNPSGTDAGYLIGAMSWPAVEITAAGDASWDAAEHEAQYVTGGPAMLTWVIANARGPWLLTADAEQRRWEVWHWLILRFLAAGDESAFRAAFPEAVR